MVNMTTVRTKSGCQPKDTNGSSIQHILIQMCDSQVRLDVKLNAKKYKRIKIKKKPFKTKKTKGS